MKPCNPSAGSGIPACAAATASRAPAASILSGEGPAAGICGVSADAMVARGLDRAIAAGTAAHSGHAKHLAHTMMKMAKGEAKAYTIKEPGKLRSVAARLGIPVEGRMDKDIALDVAKAALADFHEKETPVLWAATVVNPQRAKVLTDLDLVPKGIDHEVSEIMHRTLYGVDADPVNLLLGGLRCGVADLAGCYMATDLADILFGIPKPGFTEANLGTLKAGAVNIALHGHNPVLSDLLVTRAESKNASARAAGASGINIVGICCTGNEILMRHGIPACTHSVSQEMAIVTGALDAMVVDYQCIMPSVATVAECMGTALITTMDIGKIPGSTYIPFTEEKAEEKADEIFDIAIANFVRRKNKTVDIPEVRTPVVAGFSVEAIVAALSKLNADDPLKPVVDNIKAGNIRGVCLFAGCNNVKVPQDRNFTIMARKLLEANVLVLATGCGAGALMRHGFMDPANVDSLCGAGLKAVLTAIGEANGLGGPPASGASHGLLRGQFPGCGTHCRRGSIPGRGYGQTPRGGIRRGGGFREGDFHRRLCRGRRPSDPCGRDAARPRRPAGDRGTHGKGQGTHRRLLHCGSGSGVGGGETFSRNRRASRRPGTVITGRFSHTGCRAAQCADRVRSIVCPNPKKSSFAWIVARDAIRANWPVP